MGYIYDAMQQYDDAGRCSGGSGAGAGGDDQPRQSHQPALALAGQTEEAASPRRADGEPGQGAGDDQSVDADPLRRRADDRLVAWQRTSSIMAEEYRSIRTGLLAKWQHQRHLVHTITSATPQEGKTITSLNLGFSFAELEGRRTIVVEADLRLPQFRKLMALDDSPGLVGLLRGEAHLRDVVQYRGERNLAVIPAGTRVANNAVQLLSSGHMQQLVAALRKKFDHVIIDTPPVVELADAGILGAMSDDVLLIVRMNRTPRPLVEQAIRTLGSYNAPVAGLIATDQQRHQRRYYYKYGYRYRYYQHRYAEAA